MADFQRPLLSSTDEGQTQYGKKEIPSFGDLKDILIITGREILLIDYLKKEIMVPNVEEFVKLFDFENKIIIVNNIEQFIE